MSYITKEELSALQELSEKRMDKYLMSFVLEDLKSYRIAQQLRNIARRCPDEAAEEAGEHGTDSDGWYICKSLSHQIEELEIEEPK